MAILMALAMPVASTHAQSTSERAEVRIGNHAGYSRIVFDFPSLVAYRVEQSAGEIRLRFDTAAALAIPAVRSPLVASMIRVPGEGLQIRMMTPNGVTLKHYRLQRKVVVDVYAANMTFAIPSVEKPPAPVAMPKTEPKAEAKPKVGTAKPAPVKNPTDVELSQHFKEQIAAAPHVDEAVAPPVTPTSPVPVLAPPAVLKTEGPPVAAQPVTPVAKSSLPDAPGEAPPPEPIADASRAFDADTPEVVARISLSSLTPSRAAIFSRGDALWIVADQIAASAAPIVSGPMASLLSAPTIVRPEGGVAYRYTFPRYIYPQVKKKNLAWDVLLLSHVPTAASREFRSVDDSVTKQIKLLVPLDGTGPGLVIDDPVVGDKLLIVPTSREGEAVGIAKQTSDFETLPAALGLAIRPLVDDLKSETAGNAVMLSAPSGLHVAPQGAGASLRASGDDEEAQESQAKAEIRLFDFPNWRQGGLEKFQENKQVLQNAAAAAAMPDERLGALMRMATLYFANNFGPETLGILSLVQSENPDIDKTPDFIALRGAANALSGHFKEALQDLSYPPIQQHPEVSLWIGYAAAATEQWRMAERAFPKTNRLLLQYPDSIAIPLTIYMAESSLRVGHTDTARMLLNSINMSSPDMDPRYKAATDYLKGEMYSQEGKFDEAASIWQPVTDGLDRLYHTKASLSLAKLLLSQKKVTAKEAIERIDNLRFAWRGDGLEVEILRMLGSLKAQNGQPLAGLQDMHAAVNLADGMLDDSTPIREEMYRIFSDLFVTHKEMERVPPLEAISIYNEFGYLMPAGLEGSAATLSFADYMLSMDLLDRGAALISEQIDKGLPEGQASVAGEKLAAAYLLDNKASAALVALQRTDVPSGTDEGRQLLRARALSKLKRTDEAIAILQPLTSKDAARLRADILWQAQRWAEAAQVIESMLPVDPKGLLDAETAQLTVNAGVAWKLAGNSDRLRQLREKYSAAMAATTLASTFGVVTRDGGLATLADRESLTRISSEVDMFKGFLESYSSTKTPAATTDGADTTAPASGDAVKTEAPKAPASGAPAEVAPAPDAPPAQPPSQ